MDIIENQLQILCYLRMKLILNISESEKFYFGSVSMTSEPSRTATLSAVRFAKENNCL